MEQLGVVKKDGSNYILFELSGVFNALTAVNVQTEIYDSIVKNNVVLDLAKVVELDDAAMGVIMAAHNDTAETGTKLYLLSLSNEADKEIIRTGFKELFNIINSVTEVG